MSFFWWGPRKQDMAKSVNDFGIWIQHGFVCFCICQMLLFKLRVHPMYAFDHYACTLGIKGTIFALLMLWCTNWATGVLEHTWPCGFLACTVNASGYLRCKRLKKKKTCRCVVFHRAPHTYQTYRVIKCWKIIHILVYFSASMKRGSWVIKQVLVICSSVLFLLIFEVICCWIDRYHSE